MTTSSTTATARPTPPPATVEEAEAAWLTALTLADPEPGVRALAHPECVFVHGPVGHIHRLNDWVPYAKRVGRTHQVDTYDVTVQRFGTTAVVSCLQEMRVAFLPELTPFVIQVAVSRVWMEFPEHGWQLMHLQMARRLPPS